MKTFDLDIVTPDRLFFSEKVEMIIVRGLEGDLAVLKGRTPLTTPLKIGQVRVFQDGKERLAAVVNGYISVLGNKTTIVTECAEWPEEIDVERAEEARKRAEEILKRNDPDVDFIRAEAALKRAINRLKTAKHY
ncbi:MAG: F0F1 ATP synthase subunit epsilon [Tissierellia bacterium]|nr:F0F1 ATP synthase subunit epsilon [Tissierellia bacterium]